MKFEFRNYQYLKIKNYLKINKFFIFLNSSKIKTKNWIEAEQSLHKLKLNYNKSYTKITRYLIKNSIFYSSLTLISGMVILTNLTKINNSIKPIRNIPEIFSLLIIKLNNKIYNIEQLKNLEFTNYNMNINKLRRLTSSVNKFY